MFKKHERKSEVWFSGLGLISHLGRNLETFLCLIYHLQLILLPRCTSPEPLQKNATITLSEPVNTKAEAHLSFSVSSIASDGKTKANSCLKTLPKSSQLILNQPPSSQLPCAGSASPSTICLDFALCPGHSCNITIYKEEDG